MDLAILYGTVVILLLTADLALPQGMSSGKAEEGKLGVTVDLTYSSKWLTKGAYGYGSHGALFKTIDLDF